MIQMMRPTQNMKQITIRTMKSLTWKSEVSIRMSIVLILRMDNRSNFEKARGSAPSFSNAKNWISYQSLPFGLPMKPEKFQELKDNLEQPE